MENLHYILTEDLEVMLAMLREQHNRLVAGVLKSGEELIAIQKVIAWRRLTVAPVPSPVDKPVIF